MATSLSGKSIGNPDNAFIWYLNSGGNATNTGAAALASGFQVALGDGAETPLWIDSAGIGVRSSGGFVSKIASAATAPRTVTIADSPGTLYPAISATLAADVSNSTVTPATVASFSVALGPSATYDFELLLIFSCAASTTSPRMTVIGPAEIVYVSYELTTNDGSTATATAFGTTFANSTNPPAANAPYALRIRGVCKTTSTTPVLPVQVQIYSEVAASSITLKAGSCIRFMVR